jgi:V/A-type H+-transporting ATPase subunit F
VINDPEVAIVLMTEKLVKLCDAYVYDLKLNRKRPLIVEIPDRHATSKITTAISRYVQEAIGIKI